MNQGLALSLPVRSRIGDTINEVIWRWHPAETAILVVDMWEKHWCKGATARVKEMAQRMNPVLSKARERGIQIIHCPSETMPYYQTTPQRKRLIDFYSLRCKFGGSRWMALQGFEKPLPIDDDDGGCFCEPKCKTYRAWSRQTPILEIASNDGISDNGCEIALYARGTGIKNLIYMGVHLNMCVLGRSFGIRRMKQRGFNLLLCRDLTDTMYNPASWPHVPHEEGTQKVVAHIERHWCPTILSMNLP